MSKTVVYKGNGPIIIDEDQIMKLTQYREQLDLLVINALPVIELSNRRKWMSESQRITRLIKKLVDEASNEGM